MKSDVIKYLASVYPLQYAAIVNLYDVVEKHYKLYTEFEILEKCDMVIKNSLGMATDLIDEFWNDFDKPKAEKPRRTPEQIIVETFDKEVYKMLDFPSDNEMKAIICAMEIYANQNKKPLQDNNFIVTRHPITFQPFDKLPAPPPPRTVGSYGKETFLTKWKASKEYLFSIFNKKKV